MGPSTLHGAGNGATSGADLCLGVEQGEHGEAKIVLVPRTDTARALVFGGVREVGYYVAALAAKRVAREAAVAKLEVQGRSAARNEDFRAGLRANGFARLDSAVPGDVVRRALREINRQIGESTSR